MNYKIVDIEGIGPLHAEKFARANIRTTDEFLHACREATGRRQLSRSIGVSEPYLLRWANRVDLMRVQGIDPSYSELLEASGVDTIRELRHRDAGRLTSKMTEINTNKHLAQQVPAESVVAGWIRQAKGLPPRITY